MEDNVAAEHHDSSQSAQVKFSKDVKLLLSTFKVLGNPFLEDSNDLYALDAKLVASQDAVKNLHQIHDIGKSQFEVFVQKRQWTSSKPISDTIPKNK